jgi:glycosyltransferase involved in cell wall biosynthesis
MKVSVVICTWNRARLLDQTLSHLQQLSIPEGVKWELVLVNNNSTDHTDEIIERHSKVLPM